MNRSGLVKYKLLFSFALLCMICLVGGVSAVTEGSTGNPGNQMLNSIVFNDYIRSNTHDQNITSQILSVNDIPSEVGSILPDTLDIPSESSSESYVFVSKWGTSGSGNGQFNNPYSVAVDSSGNVYVADTGNNRIQTFSSTGTYQTQWGTSGSGNGQFHAPIGVAVNSTDGYVYVGDSRNHRVEMFLNSTTGTYWTQWGTQGSGDGQFLADALGPAVDSSGNVYVADPGTQRIQKFSYNGIFITKWGTPGSADGKFDEPYGVAVDSSGNVYVVEQHNMRIQKFNSSGTFLTKWGTSGSGDGQFSYPSGIAVDSAGNVYVADSVNHRIQKFSSTGAFLTKWGSSGTGDGQFNAPYGVAVDSSGNVFVADLNNNRIQKFAPSSSNPPVANFTGTPTSGTAPLTVTFTDSSSNTPTSWNWNFDDGNSSTLQNPTHTYTSAGTYSVALNATNSAGSNTLTRTNYVTVSAPPAPTAHLQMGAIAAVTSSGDSLTHGLQPATIQRGVSIGNGNPENLTLYHLIITAEGSHITNAAPSGVTTWNSTHIRWNYTSPVTIPPFNEMDAGSWSANLTDSVHIPISVNRWVNQSLFTSPGYQLFTYNASFKNTTCDWIFGRISAGHGQENATLLVESFKTDAPVENLRPINNRDIGFNLNMSAVQEDTSYNFSIVVFVDPTNAPWWGVDYKPWCQMMEGFNTGSRSGVLNSTTASMPADMLPSYVTNLTVKNDIPLNWNYATNYAKSMELDSIWRYPSGGPNKINGTIYYSGTQNATIYVDLFDQPPGPDVLAIKSKTMAYFGSPISYGFSTFNGTFWLGSFMDVNGNQYFDTDEPTGFAINKSFMQGPDPIQVTGNMTGLDITLFEPSHISLMLTKDFEVSTKNNTILSGIQDSRLRYQMMLLPTTPSGNELVLGNLSFAFAAQNISNVDYKQFAVWNSSTAIWIFPPEFTLKTNNGLSVTADTSTHTDKPLNMSLSRKVNQTVFTENGTQLLTVNITFTSTYSRSYGCIIDIPHTTRVHSRFIPGSASTNAPMRWIDVYDQWVMFAFNQTEIHAGVPYTLSIISQVEPNGTPVEFIPRVSASQTFYHNNTPGTLAPVGVMPAVLLPEQVTTASAAINVSSIWDFSIERDIVATLDCVVQPVSSAPVANFTANVTSGTAPLPVSFTDLSLNTPTGWAWFFGDENWTVPTWTQMNASAGWAAREGHSTVAMPDGSIVLLGGGDSWGGKNDVWRSTDNGATWTQQTASAGWAVREYHSSVVMSDGSIVLLGGLGNGGNIYNDVWRSTDNGATWTQVNASAGWTARYAHSSVVMSDGSIVLLGGYAGDKKNDVWRSTNNGVTWTEVNASAGWTARDYHSSVAMPDGSIVLLGGWDSGYNYKNDVWQSIDNGATWTQVNASPGWATRRGHRSVVTADGSIVLMGGFGAGTYNDVWRSIDNGATWIRVTASAGWAARGMHSSVAVADGSIVLMGGMDGSSTYNNNVWRFVPVGSSAQNPSHTYTKPGIYPVSLQAFNTGGYNSTRKTGYINVTPGGVQVQVIDANGNPMIADRIALESGTGTLSVTGVNNYRFNAVPTGTYQLNVTKSGYIGVNTTISYAAGSMRDFTVTLVDYAYQPTVILAESGVSLAGMTHTPPEQLNAKRNETDQYNLTLNGGGVISVALEYPMRYQLNRPQLTSSLPVGMEMRNGTFLWTTPLYTTTNATLIVTAVPVSGQTFVRLQLTGGKLGDVYYDNKVTSTDSLYDLHYVVTNLRSLSTYDYADVTRDGKITSTDALYILHYVVGNVNEYYQAV